MYPSAQRELKMSIFKALQHITCTGAGEWHNFAVTAHVLEAQYEVCAGDDRIDGCASQFGQAKFYRYSQVDIRRNISEVTEFKLLADVYLAVVQQSVVNGI